MITKILKRLDALEQQRIENQKAAERECFLNAAWLILLAYYVGGLKPKEWPFEGFARALKFQKSLGFFQAFAQALETGNAADLQSRKNDAVRRLFPELDDDRSSPEALEEAIIEMAKRLPDQWRAWITKEVEKVDYDKQTQADEWEERELARLEFFAAAEARARSRNGEFA
jgi:hypothetical protein